jgi:thioredoxin-dependent peroxiredoxin
MLKEGQKAPRFSLPSDGGKDVRLEDFAGKNVVVYFYPRDNTPGCTREAQAFAAASKDFAKLGVTVLGVSKDSVASHCGFRDKYALNFPLLSDADLSVHKAFGAYGEKMMYGKKVLGTIRSTFVVGPDGKVAKVFPSVKVDGHADAVLATLRGGGDAKAAAPAKKEAKAAKAKSAAPKAAPKKKAATAKAAPKKTATRKR